MHKLQKWGIVCNILKNPNGKGNEETMKCIKEIQLFLKVAFFTDWTLKTVSRYIK